MQVLVAFGGIRELRDAFDISHFKSAFAYVRVGRFRRLVKAQYRKQVAHSVLCDCGAGAMRGAKWLV